MSGTLYVRTAQDGVEKWTPSSVIGGGGSMTYPPGTGIPLVTGGASWSANTITPAAGYLYYNGSSFSWGTPAVAPHVLNSASHTVSGLTAGNVLKALTASTFNFAPLNIDELGNPTGDKLFTMTSRQLLFRWTNPVPTDGAMELEITGNFTGDVLHVHQLTGTPGAGSHGIHIETVSSNVRPLYLQGSSGFVMELRNPAQTFSYHIATGAISANRNLTLPAITGNDTLVALDFAQTLTNKTIAYASNTLTGVAPIANPIFTGPLTVYQAKTDNANSVVARFYMSGSFGGSTAIAIEGPSASAAFIEVNSLYSSTGSRSGSGYNALNIVNTKTGGTYGEINFYVQDVNKALTINVDSQIVSATHINSGYSFVTPHSNGFFRTSNANGAAVIASWPSSAWWGLGAANSSTTLYLGRCDSVGAFDGGGVDLRVVGNVGARATITTYGYVNLVQGGPSHSGYIEWYKAGNTRLAYMGYDNTDLTLNLENSAILIISGTMTVTGEITAYYTSDRRLKQNINYSFSGLELINRMKPATYNWNQTAMALNKDKDNRLNFGMIADELKGVTPDLIHKIYQRYDSIDYIQVVPILVKAVQELSSENTELRSKVEVLTQKLNRLN